MRRYLGRACAGILMLAAAGCTVDSILNRQVVVWGPTVFVPGNVAEVSAKVQDGLREDGLLVRTNRTGTEYRIASQSQSGIAFCLHLKQVNEPDGVRTRVRMHWDQGGDAELWQRILKILHAPSNDDGSVNQPSERTGSP